MAKDKERKILTEDEIDVEIIKEQIDKSGKEEELRLAAELEEGGITESDKDFLITQSQTPKKPAKPKKHRIRNFFKSINWVLITAICIPLAVVALVVTNVVTGGFGVGTQYYNSWICQGKRVNFRERHISSYETFSVLEEEKWEEYRETPQYLIFAYTAGESNCESMKKEILQYADESDFLFFFVRNLSAYSKATVEEHDTNEDGVLSFEEKNTAAETSINATEVGDITIGDVPTLMVISNLALSEGIERTYSHSVSSIYTGAAYIRSVLSLNKK